MNDKPQSPFSITIPSLIADQQRADTITSNRTIEANFNIPTKISHLPCDKTIKNHILTSKKRTQLLTRNHLIF